jgi:hypothetical protein
MNILLNPFLDTGRMDNPAVALWINFDWSSGQPTNGLCAARIRRMIGVRLAKSIGPGDDQEIE